MCADWLTTRNAHRDLMIELALAGHGVVRILDWTELPDLASGSLVRALADWESTEAPPVNLLYHASARPIPRVRLFLEFATELFRELDRVRGQSVMGTERPRWLWRHYGRASVVMPARTTPRIAGRRRATHWAQRAPPRRAAPARAARRAF